MKEVHENPTDHETEHTNSVASSGHETDFYLWHLIKLGIVKQDFTTPLWDCIDKGTSPILVAIIDNGADTGHPNLFGVCRDPLDFSSTIYGTKYDPPDYKNNELASEGLISNKVKELPSVFKTSDGASLSERLDRLNASPEKGGELAKIVENLENKGNCPISLPLPDPSRYFASHGTACAGLVGGRPGATEFQPEKFDRAIPYFGVNPYCQIIPICTPYSHEFLPVINALLYAVMKGADIILMPRGLDHIRDRARVSGVAVNGTRIDTRPSKKHAAPLMESDQANLATLKRHQTAFEELVCKLSHHLYLIVTAGNDGFDDALAYPASLIGGKRVSDPRRVECQGSGVPKSAENGAAGLDSLVDRHKQSVGDGFVVVGAVNKRYADSAYSNGKCREDVLKIISDDSISVRKGLFRMDPKSQTYGDYDFGVHYPGNLQNEYSPWGILSLDVRGNYGKEPGHSQGDAESDDENDRPSLYTVFGGTSAASALAAGMISLAMQTGELIPGQPPKGKQALEDIFGKWCPKL